MHPRHAVRALATVAIAIACAAAASGQGAPSAVSAWIPAPAAGATSAAAYVELNNPTMYDVYVVAATAEGVAKTVELRGAAAAGAEAPLVKELTIPAYGSTEAAAGGPHLRLVGLAKPLAAGDTVPLALTTDAGTILKVTATVKAP